MQAQLKVVHQSTDVKQVKLLPCTVIGRSIECDLRIASKHVSRIHCRIIVGDDFVSIEDLGSANGTHIDDLLLEPHQPTVVQPGAKLTIGPAQFLVDYVASTSKTAVIRRSANETTLAESDSSSAAEDHDPELIHISKAETTEYFEGIDRATTPILEMSDSVVPPLETAVRPIAPFEEVAKSVSLVDDVPRFDFSESVVSTPTVESPSKKEKRGGLKSLLSMFGRKSSVTGSKPMTLTSSTEPVSEPPGSASNASIADSSPFDFENSQSETVPKSAAETDVGVTENDDFQAFLRQL